MWVKLSKREGRKKKQTKRDEKEFEVNMCRKWVKNVGKKEGKRKEERRKVGKYEVRMEVRQTNGRSKYEKKVGKISA